MDIKTKYNTGDEIMFVSHVDKVNNSFEIRGLYRIEKIRVDVLYPRKKNKDVTQDRVTIVKYGIYLPSGGSFALEWVEEKLVGDNMEDMQSLILANPLSKIKSAQNGPFEFIDLTN